MLIYQNNEWTSFENTQVEPVEPVHMSIYQINTYRKDLSLIHFSNEPKGSKEAASETPTVLYICFCSLSKIFN